MDERIKELKNTIKELIDNIISRIDETSQGYQDTDVLENDRLLILFDDLQLLADGINVINEHDANIDLPEFQEKLVMMGTALEADDTALLTDIMQFELKGLLESWKDQLG
ncbi:MAG: hypothetical protein GX796_09850 [Clostridiaceae bacterium]|nr:hypothetical protein [Clostridiaceae bacterium]